MSGSNTPGNKPRQDDPEPNRDVNALFSNFRIDQASYRTFNRHRSIKAADQEEIVVSAAPKRRERLHVGIFSPMGGSGKSTLTASLGGVLWRMGRSVLLVDTSPWQALAFHYGANKVRPGMRSFFASESQDLPVRILACGHDDASLPDIDSYAAKTPFDYVLFDLSGANGKELIAYLQDCDILLVPMLPEPSATRLAEAMMNLLNGLTSFTGQPMFVMNKMDDSSMAKEVQTSLGHLLGDQLLPATIARQSEVQQALAEGIVLPVYAPKAQAVTICNEIARFFEAPKVALTGRAQQRWCER